MLYVVWLGVCSESVDLDSFGSFDKKFEETDGTSSTNSYVDLLSGVRERLARHAGKARTVSSGNLLSQYIISYERSRERGMLVSVLQL